MTTVSQGIIDQFGAGVRSDPRTIKAAAAWATCMSAQGFSLTTPSDMRKTFSTTAQSLIAQGAFAPSSPAHAAYTSQVEIEIQTAVANTRCEPAYRKIEDDVVAERRNDLISALGA